MKFLTGKDYPWLCKRCQAVVDEIAAMFNDGEMPDTNNEEAPCDFVYDHRMFCGPNGADCQASEDYNSERQERNLQDPGYIYDVTHFDEVDFMGPDF